jgi:hypothetical protein
MHTQTERERERERDGLQISLPPHANNPRIIAVCIPYTIGAAPFNMLTHHTYTHTGLQTSPSTHAIKQPLDHGSTHAYMYNWCSTIEHANTPHAHIHIHTQGLQTSPPPRSKSPQATALCMHTYTIGVALINILTHHMHTHTHTHTHTGPANIATSAFEEPSSHGSPHAYMCHWCSTSGCTCCRGRSASIRPILAASHQ